MSQSLVRELKGFGERDVPAEGREQPVVVDLDQRVHLVFEPLYGGERDGPPMSALEREGKGDDADGERAEPTAHLSDEGGRAGAGAAAHARGDEDHVSSIDHVRDLFLALPHRFTAHHVVAAGAHSPGGRGTYGERGQTLDLLQGLHVGVDRQEGDVRGADASTS